MRPPPTTVTGWLDEAVAGQRRCNNALSAANDAAQRQDRDRLMIHLSSITREAQGVAACFASAYALVASGAPIE